MCFRIFKPFNFLFVQLLYYFFLPLSILYHSFYSPIVAIWLCKNNLNFSKTNYASMPYEMLHFVICLLALPHRIGYTIHLPNQFVCILPRELLLYRMHFSIKIRVLPHNTKHIHKLSKFSFLSLF